MPKPNSIIATKDREPNIISFFDSCIRNRTSTNTCTTHTKPNQIRTEQRSMIAKSLVLYVIIRCCYTHYIRHISVRWWNIYSYIICYNTSNSPMQSLQRLIQNYNFASGKCLSHTNTHLTIHTLNQPAHSTSNIAVVVIAKDDVSRLHPCFFTNRHKSIAVNIQSLY